jgi:hypothetical protein
MGNRKTHGGVLMKDKKSDIDKIYGMVDEIIAKILKIIRLLEVIQKERKNE